MSPQEFRSSPEIRFLLALCLGLSLGISVFAGGCGLTSKADLREARKSLNDGHFEEAEKQAGDAIGADKNLGEAYFIRAEARYFQNDMYSAGRDYSHAIAHGYDTTECHLRRANINHWIGRIRAAITDYLAAARGDLPEQKKKELYINLSDAEFRVGEVEKSLEYAEKALELEPDNPVALANKAFALFSMKRQREANTAIDGAIKHCAKQGDSENARENEIDFHVLRKEILDSLGRSKEALEERAKVQELFDRKLHFLSRPERAQRLMWSKNNELYTRHFEFASDLAPSVLNAYAKSAEDLTNYIEKSYHPLDEAKVSVLILPDEETLSAFSEKDYRGKIHASGVYSAPLNLIAVAAGKNLDRSALHYLLFRATDRCGNLVHERWSRGGLGKLFQYAYGSDSTDENSANSQSGYLDLEKAKKRITEVKSKQELKKLDPMRIANCMSPYDEQVNDGLVMATFLLHQNKLTTYLQLAYQGHRKGYATLVEAAFDRKIEELLPQWRAFLKEIEARY
ncbi:hypothetical protein GC174_00760 [bacterium]|nr:hypothetical protein [bacterium]